MRGEGCQYSPGAPSTLTQIVPYSSSLYTVFHSVIYNSVLQTEQGEVGWANVWKMQGGAVYSLTNILYIVGHNRS